MTPAYLQQQIDRLAQGLCVNCPKPRAPKKRGEGLNALYCADHAHAHAARVLRAYHAKKAENT